MVGSSSHITQSAQSSPYPSQLFNTLSLAVPGGAPSTPGAGVSQEASSTASWFYSVQPLDAVDPYEVLKDTREKRRASKDMIAALELENPQLLSQDCSLHMTIGRLNLLLLLWDH